LSPPWPPLSPHPSFEEEQSEGDVAAGGADAVVVAGGRESAPGTEVHRDGSATVTVTVMVTTPFEPLSEGAGAGASVGTGAAGSVGFGFGA
jgi:hypothetical protein